MISPDFSGVPEQLQDKDQWLVWASETREGETKKTKVPYAPTLDRPTRASATNPDTWGSFSEARSVYLKSDRYDGIGFVFTEGDPFCGIDLDGIYDPEKEEFTDPLAEDTVKQLNSYTELSPSGTGVHIIVEGKLRAGGHRKGFFELYDRERYFTFTGHRITDQATVNHKQRQLDALHISLFPTKTEREPLPTTEISMEDQDLLDKMGNSKSADKFRALYYNGDTSLYGGDHSKADLGLCSMIAFYTQDPDQVDRIFRGSRLLRPKWDKKRGPTTYGRGTILKAIADLDATYSGAKPAKGGDKMPSNPQPAQNDSSANERVGFVGNVGTLQEDPEQNGSRNGHGGAPPRMVEIESAPIPFPVDSMPKAVRRLIREEAEALDAPVDLVAVPMLAALSTAIGNSRKIKLKKNFFVTSSLWLCVVAPPGMAKSPSAEPALRPLQKLQKQYNHEYTKAEREYELEKLERDEEKKNRKPSATAAKPTLPPDPPVRRRTTINDATLEALVSVHQDNPRGLLFHQDEISGWVRGMDQYKSGGKGNERQNYIQIYDNKNMSYDRKTTGLLTLEHPYVSLLGGIQPGLLSTLEGGVQDGLMDRILFSYPRPTPSLLTEDEASREAEILYENLFEALTKLEYGHDEWGQPEPTTVELTEEAFVFFKELSDPYTKVAFTKGFDQRLGGQWAKTRGQMGRIALILALCRFVTDKVEPDDQKIEPQDFFHASKIIEYFKQHAKRVYQVKQNVSTATLFNNALVDFLQTQEGRTFEGGTQELYDVLLEEDADHLPPSPEALGRHLTNHVEEDPRLSIKRPRKGNGTTNVLTLTDQS